MAAKVIRWALSLSVVILGIFLFRIASEGFTPAYFVAILCVGVAYLLYRAKEEIPKEILLVSCAVLGASAFAADRFGLRPLRIESGFYLAWWVWAMAIGLPCMGWAYKKYGK